MYVSQAVVGKRSDYEIILQAVKRRIQDSLDNNCIHRVADIATAADALLREIPCDREDQPPLSPKD